MGLRVCCESDSEVYPVQSGSIRVRPKFDPCSVQFDPGQNSNNTGGCGFIQFKTLEKIE